VLGNRTRVAKRVFTACHRRDGQRARRRLRGALSAGHEVERVPAYSKPCSLSSSWRIRATAGGIARARFDARSSTAPPPTKASRSLSGSSGRVPTSSGMATVGTSSGGGPTIPCAIRSIQRPSRSSWPREASRYGPIWASWAGSVPAGPALADPEPTSVADARTLSGMWMKVMVRHLS